MAGRDAIQGAPGTNGAGGTHTTGTTGGAVVAPDSSLTWLLSSGAVQQLVEEGIALGASVPRALQRLLYLETFAARAMMVADYL